MKNCIPLVTLIFVFCGCQTLSQQQKPQLQKQAQQDLKSVAGSLSNKPLTEEEWKKLQDQVKNNPEAQTAVQSVTDSLQNKKVIIKYCPVDGKRFSSHLTICPEHHVLLEILKD